MWVELSLCQVWTELSLCQVPNGTMHAVPIPAGSTSVRLTLPMAVRVEAEQAGGVSVRRPLLSAREG